MGGEVKLAVKRPPNSHMRLIFDRMIKAKVMPRGNCPEDHLDYAPFAQHCLDPYLRSAP
jgi:hypothetical protein